jgi:uncharacterized membrane protein YqiK
MYTPLLLADLIDALPYILVMAVLVCIFFFVVVAVFVKQFKTCPSNRVLVIYGRTGKGGAAKTIHGGAAFVWPLRARTTPTSAWSQSRSKCRCGAHCRPKTSA